MRFERWLYTLKHKKAFLETEKKLFNKNTLRGVLHDVDKLLLYPLLGVKTTSKLHRRFSRHHMKRAKKENDFKQMVIDWECARLTKPDKPLNAYDTLYKYYPELEDKILPILKSLTVLRQEFSHF